ncbi:barstar family protein [Kribbella sp. DT2]|uniref:barstar family protein n=1 Tax=Kribbella sp. DT2 TaxID=3393427 RepID=UPI003CEF5CB1
MTNAKQKSAEAGKGYKYALTSDEDENDFWGFAREAEGVFAPLDGGGARRVHLTACSPQGGLLKSLNHLGSRRARAGDAWLGLLASDGAEMGSYFVNHVTVLDAQPSAAADRQLEDGRPADGGSAVVDLTLDLWCDDALPGSDAMWELIRTDQLNGTGLWHNLLPHERRAWLSVALWSRRYRRGMKTDAPAGKVVSLNGRHIVDEDSFYCAIGEAVNGPGGYFGWNLDALEDCLHGGWGATNPFTVQWESAATARARLVRRMPTRGGEATLFDLILEIFEDRGIAVVLR